MLGVAENEVTGWSALSRRPMMRIVLVDDEVPVLSAERLVISREPGMVVVAESSDLIGLWAQMETHLPDVLLLDWELPNLEPGAFFKRLRRLYPALRVVALSSQPEARQQALALGADAFVSKGDAPERLLLTLHRLAASSDHSL
jgi:DNA-binding NarL/FixJ family response regulator